MSQKPYTVLFLCTGNSARSIMAEALLNEAGAGRFQAFSAGSHPTGKVNPYAIELLGRLGYPTTGLASKSWDEFGNPDAPKLDYVFTVCDNAAGETCPLWPGGPATAHWGFPDPAAATGGDAEIRSQFEDVFEMLRGVINAFVDLPLDTYDAETLKQRLAELRPRSAT